MPVVCGVCMWSCGYMHMGSTLLSVAVIKYHKSNSVRKTFISSYSIVQRERESGK